MKLFELKCCFVDLIGIPHCLMTGINREHLIPAVPHKFFVQSKKSATPKREQDSTGT